jgi:hypothetical protein
VGNVVPDFQCDIHPPLARSLKRSESFNKTSAVPTCTSNGGNPRRSA